MKIGEWLKKYRSEHNMSMQDMADLCGFSKAYVSLLEKGINPTTNKPFSPTIETFGKIARATGQDMDSLLKILDSEQLVTINKIDKFSEDEKKLVASYRKLKRNDRRTILKIISSFLANPIDGLSSSVIQNNNHGNNNYYNGEQIINNL